MVNSPMEVARNLVKGFLDQKEKGFIPDIDFVEKLLELKKGELELLGCELSYEEIKILSQEIHEKETFTISKPSTIMSKEKKPWLHTLKDIDYYYSDRYYNYLTKDAHFSRQIVDKIYVTTDEILDFMANPNSDEECIKRGLVMGNVQSGKTANYLALINRAADVGYKLVILIAGIHNNLRTQTQARVNSGFIGYDRIKEKEVGVSKYGEEKRPFSFTSTEYDFKREIASSLNFNPKDSNVPVILVIKKNSSTLKNLIDWLESNKTRSTYANYPLLLIDDEADNASINTKKHPNEATTINRQIRSILKMFKVRSYVGYTATPFANIFINPESNNSDEYGDDLFPEDFIVSLESPTNYIGAEKIFNTDDQSLRIIKVDEHEPHIPLKTGADTEITSLPDSFENAFNVYLLSIGIKKLRKISNPHTSMLINVSFKVEIQLQVKSLVEDLLKTILRRIKYNYNKSFNEMMQDNVIKTLYKTFTDEFSDCKENFNTILKEINNNANVTKVFLVNSKTKKEEKLNFDNFSKEGLNAITIGGYSLSRGFTIEGLTVSYFLRNSQMYDTLLQMGRWFGYRNGYEDLCRIYMRKDAIGWYKHISEATEELKEEFQIMNDHGLTPRDYGLKVKNHDDSLIITAKNKMNHASEATVSINYYGELIETRKLVNNSQKISENINFLNDFILNLDSSKYDQSEKKNFLWRNINVSDILTFIKNYHNHPVNIKTDSTCIEKYIIANGITEFDVAIINNNEQKHGCLEINNLKIYKELRSSIINPKTIQVSGNKSRVGSISDEKIGLSGIKELKESLNGKSLSGVDYRSIRKTPLLIIHILDIKKKDDHDNTPMNLDTVVAFGISFPGKSTRTRRKIDSVTYTVNKKWVEQNLDLDDDEDEDEDNYDEK